MKSKQKSRDDAINSMNEVFSGKNPLLLKAVNQFFPGISFAPIIKWIPEQAEDIYWIMIDIDHIAIIEIPRLSSNIKNVSVEIMDLKKYKEQSTSRESRERLETALQLTKENIKKTDAFHQKSISNSS